MADEEKSGAVKAVERVKTAMARRDEDAKAEKVAEQSVTKGWLSPKLGAELVMEQKNRIEKDNNLVRKDRMHELEVKKEARMNEEERNAHKKKRRMNLHGTKAAAAANAKEMAMKFVRQEFERRKKQA